MPAARGRNAGVSALAILAVAVAVYGWPASSPAREVEDAANARTLAGSYLAGRFARGLHETEDAADFYRTALAYDPGNEVLIEQAFIMEVYKANWARAVELSEQLAQQQPGHRGAQTLLGLAAFKAGDYAKADQHFTAAGSGPIGELTSALSRAWVKVAEGNIQAALDLLEVPKQADWAQFYLRYHRALIADVGGRKADARTAYERVFRQDSRTLRTTLAYAQSAAKSGDAKLARQVLKEHLERTQSEGHPLARNLLDRITAGHKVDFIATSPSAGLSEVFYGLGEALTGESSVGLGVMYLQLALFLEPEQPFALASLAVAHETMRQYQSAIDTYDRIPRGTPLQQSIEIRKALNFNSLDKVDTAKELLENVSKQDPSDIKSLDALGNIMRARKRYPEAADYYTRALALVPKPEKRHWNLYYARGTCNERLKKWPAAEADLQKALELSPDQPLVLNYLGYSWIDQGRNLKQGMQLIERAVAMKPDDGYIVDSLGWAHFRQGAYREAVRFLERAVELRPDDPVLNDHLGDALWRVGREREARFQWEQSLALGPEPEDVETIKLKLSKGLAATPQAKNQKKAKQAAGTTASGKSKQSKLVPPQLFE